uniref:protein-serine/threonine phosphatase n=1 Tax=Hemiselmis andersenii TaxID=464988 RepID=A0A6U2C421_HEMAN|mmetsp:Transcript_19149/g.44138  ORF Transcript_19149/g.44138 Transcript_19149/m.44138 type:complete len:337 (+) Transcript_19149:123-1133(+)
MGDAAQAGKDSQVKLKVKWNGKAIELDVSRETTVGEVRERLQELTEVQVKRQKLIGLGKKANPPDDATLDSLQLKSSHAFMMVGSAESNILPDASALGDELPEVVNDLDWDFVPDEQTDVGRTPENRKKLEEKVRTVDVRIISEPRPGKKLLVLDLDYTLLDFKGTAENMNELKRPYCDELLTACYEHFDIVVWSQTSWRWLEMKLTEMGILQNPAFKVAFVLDRTSMFSVQSRMSDGRLRTHEVKPLEFIWTKFPEYNASNTVHIDDLSRNFAMNPKQGLRISAFRESVRVRKNDRELFFLAHYLVHIAINIPDFLTLKHSRWSEYVAENVPGLT